jgi:hypothetical protein
MNSNHNNNLCTHATLLQQNRTHVTFVCFEDQQKRMQHFRSLMVSRLPSNKEKITTLKHV